MSSQAIRVVTDVSSELEKETLDELKITLVPGYINEGDESTLFDGFNLDRKRYYDELRDKNPLPTTAAPAPGIVREILDKVFGEADHLVILTLPRNVSAYQESFRLGSEHLPEGSVTLVDSGTLGSSQDMQVLAAAKTAQAGDSLEMVLDAIKRARAGTVSATALSTMENLRRSGRVNMAQAGLATLLQIKPILAMVDGEVVTYARVRTFRKARLELLRLLREHGPYDRLVVEHANNPQDADWLAEQAGDLVTNSPHIGMISPIMGTHLGPGAVGY
ncbi:MAG: DegV family protein, partial [Anaerolineaceae bacterium]|nr:DegV family protein [Anaerolineaceae bacterium]